MHPQCCDFVFKILLIGNSSVGKTSLLQCFAEQVSHESILSTIGVDLKIRTIIQPGSTVKLKMWDTAGQQRYKTISPLSYRDAQGIIMVFDLTSRSTFSAIGTWLEEADRHSNRDPVRILVGNKLDLHDGREVSEKEAQQYAQKEGLIYYQASARNNINVNAIFQRLSSEMKQSFAHQYIQKYKKTKVYLTPIGCSKSDKTSSTCC